ncbi:MAG TPA: hypothetical protein VHB73_02090 [Alphaproteobacteria bacterium]|nr:hypothetical protein [Alphaproteobacteria bacterium]
MSEAQNFSPQYKPLHESESKIGIAFSSKGRTEWSRQTILPLLESGADIFWFDGSGPGEGRELPCEFYSRSGFKEHHRDVTGGPAVAITYALHTLYERGYEYIGLVENDVLLSAGWLDRVMGLFATPAHELGNWKVGAASARSYATRMVEPRDGYGIMANVGAGMIVFRRECIPPILNNWRCPWLYELEAMFAHYLGLQYPTPTSILQRDPELKKKNAWCLTHDWYFEAVILAHGYLTLACTPSMAVDLDEKVEDKPTTESTRRLRMPSDPIFECDDNRKAGGAN